MIRRCVSTATALLVGFLIAPACGGGTAQTVETKETPVAPVETGKPCSPAKTEADCKARAANSCQWTGDRCAIPIDCMPRVCLPEEGPCGQPTEDAEHVCVSW